MEDKRSESPGPAHATTVERTSDREVVISRVISGPAHLVFEAWTRPELFRQWWVPKSSGLTLVSCEIDARVGGGYRLVFVYGDSAPMAFHGRYLEVTPGARLVWTNEEAGDAGQLSTVTFQEHDGRTKVVLRELYPSKEALDADLEAGSLPCSNETFEQLDALLAGTTATA